MSLYESPRSLTIPKNARPWIDEAKTLIQDHRLVPRLGLIASKDKIIFSSFFAERLMRYEYYDDNLFLNHPTLDILRKTPIICGIVEYLDQRRQTVKDTKEDFRDYIDRFVTKHYPTVQARIHAHRIELAVGDLTFRSQYEHNERTLISITDDLANEWANKWKIQLKETGNYPKTLARIPDISKLREEVGLFIK